MRITPIYIWLIAPITCIILQYLFKVIQNKHVTSKLSCLTYLILCSRDRPAGISWSVGILVFPIVDVFDDLTKTVLKLFSNCGSSSKKTFLITPNSTCNLQPTNSLSSQIFPRLQILEEGMVLQTTKKGDLLDESDIDRLDQVGTKWELSWMRKGFD